MRRCLSLILCLILAVSLLPPGAAAAGMPTVRVPNARAKAGETVALKVAVENNPGIFALTFSFRYDTSRLKLVSVTPNTSVFPGAWQAGSLKGATWASNAGDISANDTILTMTFEVLEDAAAGDANVEVVLGEIINEDMDDIEFSSVPGVITISSGETPPPSTDPTVRVPNAQAKAGETVALKVAVENNPGIFALTFSFQYDTSRLKLVSVTPNTSVFPGAWQAGSLKGATWASNAGDISANDTILTMTFEVLEDAAAGDANVEVILGEIINEDMDDIEFISVPGVITVQEQVPVTLEDGYYLIRPDWSVNSVDAQERFEHNPNSPGEYMLDAVLNAGDEIKVVHVENGSITGWWPDGIGTQYTVDAAHAGNVTIYFKTGYVDAWAEFGGFFYIAAQSSPAGYTVNLTDYTKGGASVAGVENGGVYSGSVTFTVAAASAVVVAVKDGDSYSLLECKTSGDTHSFTVNVTGDTEIVLAFMGDADLNGKVTTTDGTMIKRAAMKTYTFDSQLQPLVSDVNGDGTVKTTEGTMVSRAAMKTYTLPWSNP